jgi:hypothetical protein
MSVVCVTADPGGEGMAAVAMPREVDERVQVAPAEVLARFEVVPQKSGRPQL